MVAIDVDARTLYVEAGLDADTGPEHPAREAGTREAGAFGTTAGTRLHEHGPWRTMRPWNC